MNGLYIIDTVRSGNLLTDYINRTNQNITFMLFITNHDKYENTQTGSVI